MVYVALEANHRYKSEEAIKLLNLIKQVYEIYPTLTTATHRPEIVAIGKLVFAAWDKCNAYNMQSTSNINTSSMESLAHWVHGLRQCLGLAQTRPLTPADTPLGGTLQEDISNVDLFDLDDLDLDNFDWSAWEGPYLNSGWYTSTT